MKIPKQSMSVLYAILAAVLYAVSTPFSKLLILKIPPVLMAALLYLGAGFGMLAVSLLRKKLDKTPSVNTCLTKSELPFAILMIILDIAAPIFFMLGLSNSTAANVSLLNNLEIVATAIVAMLVFKEAITRRLWLAIILIVISSIILSVEDISSFSFSIGSLFVLLACICWGFENNCTRVLSHKDCLSVVVIKGFGSGTGSLIIALLLGETAKSIAFILLALLLGFIAYGLSIFFYVYAQRGIGAAKTSAFYAIAPFIGALLSFVMLKETINIPFIIALVIMLAGTYFAFTDK